MQNTLRRKDYWDWVSLYEKTEPIFFIHGKKGKKNRN